MQRKANSTMQKNKRKCETLISVLLLRYFIMKKITSLLHAALCRLATEKLSRSGNIIFIENANSVSLLFVIYCSKLRNGVESMIYKCDNPYCGFLFERVGEVDCCPDCGHDDIRPANEEEQKEYLERKNKKR